MKLDIHKIIFIIFALVFILYFLVCFAYTYFPNVLEGMGPYSLMRDIQCNGNDIDYNASASRDWCGQWCDGDGGCRNFLWKPNGGGNKTDGNGECWKKTGCYNITGGGVNQQHYFKIFGSVQGPQGSKGDKGSPGDPGKMGPQGIQGNTGNTGPQGAQGNTGNQGNQGNQGDTGPQGVTGPQGNTGEQGDQGEQGDMGKRGYQGYDGVASAAAYGLYK